MLDFLCLRCICSLSFSDVYAASRSTRTPGGTGCADPPRHLPPAHRSACSHTHSLHPCPHRPFTPTRRLRGPDHRAGRRAGAVPAVPTEYGGEWDPRTGGAAGPQPGRSRTRCTHRRARSQVDLIVYERDRIQVDHVVYKRDRSQVDHVPDVRIGGPAAR
jgi:hypothetical protein